LTIRVQTLAPNASVAHPGGSEEKNGCCEDANHFNGLMLLSQIGCVFMSALRWKPTSKSGNRWFYTFLAYPDPQRSFRLSLAIDKTRFGLLTCGLRNYTASYVKLLSVAWTYEHGLRIQFMIYNCSTARSTAAASLYLEQAHPRGPEVSRCQRFVGLTHLIRLNTRSFCGNLTSRPVESQRSGDWRLPLECSFGALDR
jgi:hypothetical protein